jgi:hypothetical protein
MRICIAMTDYEQEQADFASLRDTGFYGKMGAGALIFLRYD